MKSNGRSGFSMVQILVAVGLMSTLALVFVAMVGSQNRMLVQMEIFSRVRALKGEVAMYLAVPEICKYNFAHVAVDPGALPADVDITEISVFDVNGKKAGDPMVKAGEKLTNLPQVRVKSMKMKDLLLVSNTPDPIISYNLKIESEVEQYIQTNEVVIPIIARVSADSQIEACVAGGDPSSVIRANVKKGEGGQGPDCHLLPDPVFGGPNIGPAPPTMVPSGLELTKAGNQLEPSQIASMISQGADPDKIHCFTSFADYVHSLYLYHSDMKPQRMMNGMTGRAFDGKSAHFKSPLSWPNSEGKYCHSTNPPFPGSVPAGLTVTASNPGDTLGTANPGSCQATCLGGKWIRMNCTVPVTDSGGDI